MKFVAIILFVAFLYGCATEDLVKEMDASYIEAHKVLVTLKNGSKVSGYVFWGFYYQGQYPFEPKKFLDYFLKHDHLNTFELYQTFSRINDGGTFGGYAESEEDKLDIHANSVANIESIPDQLEGTRLNAFCFLGRKQIKVMQGRFLFEEDYTLGQRYYHALNYDPRVSKKKLHQLFLDFRKSIDKDQSNWEWNSTAKSWKVVFWFIDMEDD